MATTQHFALGQRWLSNTESEIGLGTIVAVNIRTIEILFPATGETRTYAPASAPLTRVQFDIGDTVTSHESWCLVVEKIDDDNGMLTYLGNRTDTGQSTQLKETFVDHHFQLNQPQQRLLAGQVDEPKWFALREKCIRFQNSHETSPLLGFVGARVDIIPHQLHIAAEVGSRYAPRVLLADEVGLGKTIEAALIIHQQLLTNRAQRILIIVPDSLVHQWLVEMLRKVNLAFSIFDETRCEAMAEEGGNPFESEQLVLCSLDFLTHNSRYFQQACEAPWDLMVVDEAHHLTWSTGQASQEYQVIEQLADVTKGVLLLTATPDQLGHESHFARLRLLDPARFHSYQAFVEEEATYAQLASAIEPLLENNQEIYDLSLHDREAIKHFAGDDIFDNNDISTPSGREKLIAQLLDRHGTSRVLFRNSRRGVKGFPARKMLAYPLTMPQEYQQAIDDADDVKLSLLLCPDRAPSTIDSWANFDPRIDWFVERLQSLKGQKVLTICSHASTALILADTLKRKYAVRAGVFHEGMTIVERDRTANFFAQQDDGAQVLICSEIGSEGRNFQFAHHLVLFDLPRVPDLLEQRIGRLDRIGQKHDVHIHVPYFVNTAQHVMLDWYHEGLNAFEQTCPVGTNVFTDVEEPLMFALLSPSDMSLKHALVDQTFAVTQALRNQMEQGRDKLLEISSSGQQKVRQLLDAIGDAEQSPVLERFMTELFDTIGVLQEEKDESCYLLRQTEAMHTQLPGLNEEGMTITYERSTATSLENVHFYSWDHPMVQHCMDTITTDVHGKSAIGMQRDKRLPAGFYWLECLFVLTSKAPKHLQMNRFLPPTPFKLCIDAKLNLVDKHFHSLESVNQSMATQLVKALQTPIESALEHVTELANDHVKSLREQCLHRMQQQLTSEKTRLAELAKVNPSIRPEEIAFIDNQSLALEEAIGQADVHLEAIRLIVNNH